MSYLGVKGSTEKTFREMEKDQELFYERIVPQESSNLTYRNRSRPYTVLPEPFTVASWDVTLILHTSFSPGT